LHSPRAPSASTETNAAADPTMLDFSPIGLLRRNPLQKILDTERRMREGAPRTARVVSIASGKGGTGKSVLATNLAVIRARRGERVLLIDFDAGLANDHLLLGLAPQYDLGHVAEGRVGVGDAMIEGPAGIRLLSGGVGRHGLANPTRRELERLFKALRPLEDEFDLILVDHGAGIAYSTLAHLAAATTLLIVTSHEITGLSDAYALYKRSRMINADLRVGVVFNRVPDVASADSAWERFRGACRKFLGSQPDRIGTVPSDRAVAESVGLRLPVCLSEPSSPAGLALDAVARWPQLDVARSVTAFYERAVKALR
jgi:flagellar biosynthesis protein FlhG